MPLSIIMAKDVDTEEHAAEAVRRVLKYTFDPYAPRLPEASTVYMRKYCQEGHEYWAPMERHDELCTEHRDDPEVRAKYD